ncbi:MliC family protein [Ruegeria sp. HKCCD8929]|uniref:MliC family protein n=1 Tax=Ruegeria sp. HKCCD8929 TaxID=2683006 RepID=UPI0020C1C37D|nr:MliC family protein [Ruegeria sp. HKCCD8929]
MLALIVLMAADARAEIAVSSVVFTCEWGVTLPITYIDPSDEPGFAVVMVDGKLVAMRQARSGSGVRYVAVDEQDGYWLRIKGRDATVSYLAADHTASEQVLLKECRSD